MPNDEFSLMGAYIRRRTGETAPATETREVVKTISFSAIELDYHGRGMELPDLSYIGEGEDSGGKFVLMRWGYGTNHHSVSSPVVFKDRRAKIVELVTAHKEQLKIAAIQKQKQIWQAELVEMTRQSDELSELIINAEITRIFVRTQAQLAREEIIKDNKTGRTHLDGETRAFYEALIVNEPSQLQLFSQGSLRNKLQELSQLKTQLTALIDNMQLNTSPDQVTSQIEQECQSLFRESAGVCCEVQVTNPVAGKPTLELEIADTLSSATPGTMRLVAHGIHIPKPFPTAYIALGLIERHFMLHESEILGQETVGSKVNKQGGIYRTIHFSSGTGRHSGDGYLEALPERGTSS